MEPDRRLVHSFGSLTDLGEEIATACDFNEMIRTSLHLLLGTLAIMRGAVIECLPDQDRCVCIAQRGLSEGYEPAFILDAFDRMAISNDPSAALVLDGSGSAVGRLVSRHRKDLQNEAIELVMPMVVRGEVAGLILLGGKASGEHFTADDMDVVLAMVRHIGVGIHTQRLLAQVEQRAVENQRLYEDLRAIYTDTVRAFAAAIDMKDKYTQGHSERVGKYSEIIAREMGWTEEEIEGIKIAGYLHDVGKLVVERDVINAPYRIDAKASTELNRHPLAGYEILAPIRHPYADIPLMAKYHHERIDGSGYPDGLVGDEIPIGARIVSLADAFDAMTTDRPYKKRRSLYDVIEDFRKTAGKQFDAEVVIAFCRVLLREAKGETSERRIMKLLGKNYVNSIKIVPMLTDLIAELDPTEQPVAFGS